MIRIGSCFSGVGGLDLAVHEHFGGEPAWFVECETFPQRVLAKRWSGVPIFDDVRAVGAHNLPPIDVFCGGPPCALRASEYQRKRAVRFTGSSLLASSGRLPLTCGLCGGKA